MRVIHKLIRVGQGTKLSRNESVRSTTSMSSILSTATIDEPDLTFLQNRAFSHAEAQMLLEGKEALTSISEEGEDGDASKAKRNGSVKTGNGHAYPIPNGVTKGNAGRFQ